MDVQLIDSAMELELLREDWQRLAGSNPLHSPDWLIPWWEVYGGGNRLCVLVVHDDGGKVVAIAPLYIDSERRTQTLRCLGSGKVCTDYISIFADSQFAPAAHRAIAQFLIDAIIKKQDFRLPGTQFIEFEGATTDAAWLDDFRSAMESCDFLSQNRPLENSWFLPLPSDWDEYYRSLSSNWRRKARKADKRLQSGEVTVHCSTAATFSLAFDTFESLHQLRWGSVGDGGCFEDPRFGRFLRRASEQLLHRDRVRILWCELDGVPIAAHYQLLNEQTVFMYQTGIDPSHKKLEPGHVLMVASIRRAIAEGRTGFDYLRGDEPYKSKWGGQPIPLTKIRFVVPLTSARIQNQAESAARKIRDAFFPR
jgi:CelD/BcsL family acetyltransferase involved in cellulose biosynthesis